MGHDKILNGSMDIYTCVRWHESFLYTYFHESRQTKNCYIHFEFLAFYSGDSFQKIFSQNEFSRKITVLFWLTFQKKLTWYQSGTRPQNYFYNLYIARTSPGHSEDNILKFPTLNSSLKEMMTFRTITFRRKKELYLSEYAQHTLSSKHICLE